MTMVHVDWELDEYAPNYHPVVGERIFVDHSIEAEEKIRREQIERCWDSGEYPMKEMTDLWTTKKEALKYFLDKWRFGEPTIITLKNPPMG